MFILKNKIILVTGGTGSFGNMFVPTTLDKYNPLNNYGCRGWYEVVK